MMLWLSGVWMSWAKDDRRRKTRLKRKAGRTRELIFGDYSGAVNQGSCG